MPEATPAIRCKHCNYPIYLTQQGAETVPVWVHSTNNERTCPVALPVEDLS